MAYPCCECEHKEECANSELNPDGMCLRIPNPEELGRAYELRELGVAHGVIDLTDKPEDD